MMVNKKAATLLDNRTLYYIKTMLSSVGVNVFILIHVVSNHDQYFYWLHLYSKSVANKKQGKTDKLSINYVVFMVL